jgi:hypothetical protein
MKKKLIKLFFILFVFIVVISVKGDIVYEKDTNLDINTNEISFKDNNINSLATINATNINKQILNDLEIVNINNNTWIDVIIPKYKLNHLNDLNIEYKILINDFDKYSASRARFYKTLEEAENFIFDIASNYTNITKLYNIGTTHQGRDIWCLEISDNPGVDENEPGVLFTGLHHAREWPTLEICLYIMENLTLNYGNDDYITNLIDNRRLWIVPCVNPDGYYYDHDLGNDWRKNRHFFSEFNTWGVDLNRNYGGSSNGDPDGSWGSIGDGSISHYPSNSLYCGPDILSENETKVIKDILLNNDISAMITWHTHGEIVIWPWGYSETEVTPDNVFLSQVGIDIAGYITKQFGSGTYTPKQASDLYPTSGDTTDWVYGYSHYVLGRPTFAYTIEACDTFHPSDSYLEQVCMENYEGGIYLLQEAENISNITSRVLTSLINSTSFDTDGNYTISWDVKNSNSNPEYFQLDEITNISVFTDDLEQDLGLWDIYGFSIDDSRYHSYNKSFKSRYQNSDVSSITTTNPIPINEGMNLSFWCWYEIENLYDYAYVEVSTDGRFYEVLEKFTDVSNEWEYREYSLNKYVNKSIYIRFRYATDGGVLDEGFYVDDIYPTANYGDINIISNSIANYSIEITNRSIDDYYYRVRGYNTDHQWCDYSTLHKVKVFQDILPPSILDIHDYPDPQAVDGFVNITCDITDYTGVSDVYVNISGPLGFTNVNVSMISDSINGYYYNNNYSIEGNYSYSIWAMDPFGNGITTTLYKFRIITGDLTIDYLPLNTGWNLLSLSVENDMNMASHVAENISGCLTVNKWDAANQTYKPYIVGGPPDFDFPVDPGIGLFVEVSKNSTFVISGTAVLGVSVDLYIPWNLIGWYQDYDTTAINLADNITGCLTVNMWDALNQTYKPYIVGGPPDFDFPIFSGMGLFVEVDTVSTWNGEG